MCLMGKGGLQIQIETVESKCNYVLVHQTETYFDTDFNGTLRSDNYLNSLSSVLNSTSLLLTVSVWQQRMD